MKRKVQQSKADALRLDDIELILKKLNELDYVTKRFLFVCLTYGGYRIGELLHQQEDWIHINDNYSKLLGMDYVQIPEKGQFCTCRDCKLQSFLERESKEAEKVGIAYTEKWYKEIIKKFEPDKETGRYWEPKTEDGARKIPILYDIFKGELSQFYGNNKRFDYTRQWAWKQIKEISMLVWGWNDIPSKKKANTLYRIPNKELYPHALRATAASFWALKGINATALKEIMGWKSIALADIYVMSDEKQALQTCKELVEKEKKHESYMN